MRDRDGGFPIQGCCPHVAKAEPTRPDAEVQMWRVFHFFRLCWMTYVHFSALCEGGVGHKAFHLNLEPSLPLQ
jgi:hypothetical protein